MKQGIQTTFKDEKLRKWGCYFFTLLRWSEILRNKWLKQSIADGGQEFEFTDDEIINLYKTCEERGWVEGNCFIVNPVEIMNHCNNFQTFRTVYHSKGMPHTDYFPIYLKKPSIGHFVLGNRDGIVWDSWEPSAKSQGFPIDGYRVLR